MKKDVLCVIYGKKRVRVQTIKKLKHLTKIIGSYVKYTAIFIILNTNINYVDTLSSQYYNCNLSPATN